jgi:hypothetical protein
MSHCGLDYPFPGLDLLLPHDQWEKLFPEFGGRGGLCPNCISIRAERLEGAWSLRAFVEGAELTSRVILRKPAAPEPISREAFEDVRDEDL